MRTAITIPLAVVLLIALAATASAQVTFAGLGSPGLVEMSYLPTAAYPNGDSPVAPIGGFPNASLLSPIVAGGLAGGMACDQTNAWVYTTNGVDMAMDENPNFLPFGFTAAPPLVGTMPIAIPAALGPVTGLGFDDANQILWACNASSFFGLNPLPPFNMIVLPQPIPLAGPPASGLGYDPCDGTLWACDTQGGIYHFTPAAVPIGAQPVNIVPTLTVLGGLTVSTHNGAGAIPAPACSTQIPGYHVTVTDGINLHDALGAAPSLTVGGGSSFNVPYGLASSADWQRTFCQHACGSPFPPIGGMRQPLTSAGFNSIELRNATPSTPCFLILDLCPQLPCWNGLMMNPFTWTLLPSTTDGFGNDAVGFFAGGFPKGFQFSFQWAIQDPLAPLGYCFSNLSTQTVGTP